MKRIILIRHGESDHHLHGLTGGWTESHLTALGERQSHVTGERLAELLEGVEFGLYSSDLARAAETARIVGERLDVNPVLDADLREFNNGEAADITWEQAQEIQEPPTEPLVDHVPYPGAESWRMMNERVCRCLERVADECADTAVIISHTLSGMCVVHWWLRLGVEWWDTIAYDFAPCSLTLLTINVFEERTISRLNDTRHLATAGCESDAGSMRAAGG